VNSTSDLFHESIPDEWIDRIYAVMALCPQHTFQVLTKRPERMRAYMNGPAVRRIVGHYADRLRTRGRGELAKLTALDIACDKIGLVEEYPEADIVPRLEDRGLKAGWPLRNVWLGTSVEDQATANARIPHLLATPAAIRFISAEPLLGALDLTRIVVELSTAPERGKPDLTINALTGWHGGAGDPARLDWVIVGGESGPGARPMHPDWARSIRDQCEAAGVAFFFKQWGEWGSAKGQPGHLAIGHVFDDGYQMIRLGKARAGRLLDGREWNQMPGEGGAE
jgi:protein gp37